MAIKTFSAGSVLTASDTNTYLANAGLVYVTQVTVGSGVSSVNITSCFSSTYDNYLILFANITQASGATGGTLNYKLLSGSTPTTAGFYGNTFYVATGTAGGLSNAPFSNTANGEAMSIGTSSTNSGKMEIQSPYLSQYTRSQHMSADNNYVRWNSMVHASATSYDGIQFLPVVGSITGGTITVYGYRKA